MTKFKEQGWGYRVRCALLMTPLILSILSVLWMGYKRHLARVAVAPESKYFRQAYSLVSTNFADPVSPEASIYHGAIPGMLRSLDPHSTFFDQEEFRKHNEAMNGHRTGIGIELKYRDDLFIIVGCHSNSPALRAGIHPGDLIQAVNGQPVANWQPSKVLEVLSSPKSTTVQLSVLRDGATLDFRLQTEVMTSKSVPDAAWVRPGVAYLAILVFDEGAGVELEQNLKKCQEHGMQGLILDLRDNPGGVIKGAVAVADRLLRPGEIILSQRGRLFSTTYTATHGNGGREFPMVILVNRNTASAAEALAGALQDHDRAWIIGDDTYGKGMIQTVNSLPANTGLALVKSKYYTPSGRLVQRPKFDAALGHYVRNVAQNLVAWMTDSGRPVYASSGIGPDEHYALKLDAFEGRLKGRFVFSRFTNRYLAIHAKEVDANWQPDQDLVREFRDYLRQRGIEFTNTEFVRHQEWVRQRLRQVVLRTVFGLEETQRLLAAADPMVRRAADELPKAQSLLEAAGRAPQNPRPTQAKLYGTGQQAAQ